MPMDGSASPAISATISAPVPEPKPFTTTI